MKRSALIPAGLLAGCLFLFTGLQSNPYRGLIAREANLKAIWSTEQVNDLFWAVAGGKSNPLPLIECPARNDELIAWKNAVGPFSPMTPEQIKQQ